MTLSWWDLIRLIFDAPARWFRWYPCIFGHCRCLICFMIVSNHEFACSIPTASVDLRLGHKEESSIRRQNRQLPWHCGAPMPIAYFKNTTSLEIRYIDERIATLIIQAIIAQRIKSLECFQPPARMILSLRVTAVDDEAREISATPTISRLRKASRRKWFMKRKSISPIIIWWNRSIMNRAGE